MKKADFTNNIFTDYISSLGSKNYTVNKHCTLTINQDAFYQFMEDNWSIGSYPSFIPRLDLDYDSNIQTLLANDLGYCAHNTSKFNWGKTDEHDNIFKQILGKNTFEALNLDPDKSQVRLLCYMPGNVLPVHWDGYEVWQKKFNTDDIPIRYSVLVNTWSYGHYLQIADKVITNWSVGDTYLVPYKVLHCSGNGGILPKVTLTITGMS